MFFFSLPFFCLKSAPGPLHFFLLLLLDSCSALRPCQACYSSDDNVCCPRLLHKYKALLPLTTDAKDSASHTDCPRSYCLRKCVVLICCRSSKRMTKVHLPPGTLVARTSLLRKHLSWKTDKHMLFNESDLCNYKSCSTYTGWFRRNLHYFGKW